ncbi:AraC protein [Actinobacillus pleuropneumoniae]|nr:AraC protein [Actinobacillus pleuropneumoniae]
MGTTCRGYGRIDAGRAPLRCTRVPGGTSFYWLHFQSAASSTADHASISHNIKLPRQGHIPYPEQAYQLFDTLHLQATEPRSTAFWREQTLFIELLELLDPSRSDQEQSRVRKVAEQVESYIKMHYREPISNARLSSDLHFHYNYLTRCMKASHGVTPTEYLLQYRLDQAKRLLLTTQWSMARIADHVGFQYPPYFSRRFSARFGPVAAAIPKAVHGISSGMGFGGCALLYSSIRLAVRVRDSTALD